MLCSMNVAMQINNETSNSVLGIGLMSGTSGDGIDAALIEIGGQFPDLEIEQRGFVCVPFEAPTREKMLCASEMKAPELALLNIELGERFADAALRVLDVSQVLPRDVAFIGSHGQTVCHLPQQNATLQIGEAAVIAERTGITTVCDFRPRDVAAGGQGAPLVPIVDYLLFRDATRGRIVQNIGGIANWTWIAPDSPIDEVLACDCGPGNMVMDEVVRQLTDGALHFDKDGAMAARGRVDESWLRVLLQNPYFAKSPPKTCGREQFGQAFAREFLNEAKRRGLSDNDCVATATALTAASIVESYLLLSTRSAPVDVILCGGGAFNPTLRDMISESMQTHHLDFALHTLEDFGWQSDAKEAVAFAVLGFLTLHNLPGNVPSATGARRSVVLGKIVPA